MGASRSPRDDRHQVWLRHGAMRGVHGACRRRRDAFLCAAPRRRQGQVHYDHRRAFFGSHPCSAKSLARDRRASMRLLPVRTNHVRGGASQDESQTQRCRYRCGNVRQYLPMRYLPKNPQGHSPRRGAARDGCSEMRPVPDLSSRDFLNATATVGGGLILALTLPGRGGKPNSAVAAGAASAAPGAAHRPVSQLNAWLKIARDNSITVIVDRSEMGQGVYTALPMLLAEELDITLDAIQIVAAPVGDAYINPGNGGQVTGTSNSVQDAWDKLRMAGATARTMLISAAAKRWGVDPATCHAERGTGINAHGNTLTYGEQADAAAKPPHPQHVQLKPKVSFELIGKSRPRID